MKYDYKLEYSGSSKLAANLISLMAQDKSGEIIARHGMNQSNFCSALAKLSFNVFDAGKDAAYLADVLGQVGATNCSAAGKSVGDAQIWFGTRGPNDSFIVSEAMHPLMGDAPEADEETGITPADLRLPRPISLSSHWGKSNSPRLSESSISSFA